MKKFIAICACAASVWAFGAANDVVLTFSSKGPDIYADGTQVLDRECYALVWIPNGSTGFAIAADGTEVDSAQGKIVLTLPVAKDGRCPTIAFQLGASVADKYTNGEWALYLLDTRKVAANGKVTLAGVANGRAMAVNAAGLVTSGSVKAKNTRNDSAPASLEAGASSASAAVASAVPADAPKPQIKGIKVEGDYVYVTVANTAPYLQYNLTAGDTPSTISEERAAETPVNGSADEDIILVTPVNKNGGGFFRVERN